MAQLGGPYRSGSASTTYPQYIEKLINLIKKSKDGAGPFIGSQKAPTNRYIKFYSKNGTEMIEDYKILPTRRNVANFKKLKDTVLVNHGGQKVVKDAITRADWNKITSLEFDLVPKKATLRKSGDWSGDLHWVDKDQLKKDKFIGNRGDVSEGIACAAIACRFIHKDKVITVEHIRQFISKIPASWKRYGEIRRQSDIEKMFGGATINKARIFAEEELRERYKDSQRIRIINAHEADPKTKKTKATKTTSISVGLKSHNFGTNIEDDVLWFLCLNPKDLDAFKKCGKTGDDGLYSEYANEFQSAARAANGRAVRQVAYTLWENGHYDLIEILGVGPVAQKDQKIDITVTVNYKEIPALNISMKAGDVKQFGQVGGSQWESAQKTFIGAGDQDKFPSLLSPTGRNQFNIIKNDYNKLLGKSRLLGDSGCFGLAYRKAAVLIQADLNKRGGQDKFLERLGKYINAHATGGDEVDLWQFKKGDTEIWKFDDIARKIRDGGKTIHCGFQWAPKAKDTPEGIPQLVIWESENKHDTAIKKDQILIQIRIKKENKDGGVYIRNYIEKHKALGTYLAEAVSVGEVIYKKGATAHTK